MSSWTSQGGFPLLSVKRNYLEFTEIVRFTQKRYTTVSSNETNNATWWIPINYATENNPNFGDTQAIHWFPQKDNFSIYVPSLSSNNWLMMNIQETGYFRVLYDEQNYKLISDAMVRNVSDFHELNRAQLIDDTYNFVLSGQLGFNIFLDVIRFLEYVHDYAAWYPAVTAFATIDLRFSGSENYLLLRVLIKK